MIISKYAGIGKGIKHLTFNINIFRFRHNLCPYRQRCWNTDQRPTRERPEGRMLPRKSGAQLQVVNLIVPNVLSYVVNLTWFKVFGGMWKITRLDITFVNLKSSKIQLSSGQRFTGSGWAASCRPWSPRSPSAWGSTSRTWGSSSTTPCQNRWRTFTRYRNWLKTVLFRTEEGLDVCFPRTLHKKWVLC